MSNSREHPLVVLIGFIDTKLMEHALVHRRLTELGCDVKVIDISLRGSKVDVKCLPISMGPESIRDMARRSGRLRTSVGEEALSRVDELDVMIAGATEAVLSYQDGDKLCGIMGFGGSTTTAAVASVMRSLNIGLPKLVVSTMASGDVSVYLGDSDITIMPSIVDVSGKVNSISTRILKNASAAMAGMAHEYVTTFGGKPGDVDEGFSIKRIAITMFGLTTPGVNAAMKHLATFKHPSTGKELYNPVVFHATGSGGRCMERLIDEGWFDGVIDMTTTELADNIAGGVLSAGPTRLTAAGKAGIPQVVSLGALDMVNFGATSSIPSEYQEAKRLFNVHNSSVTLMRTNQEECRMLGAEIAGKLRMAKNASQTTAVVIPLLGWSGLDVEGQTFYDKTADQELVSALKAGLENTGITVVEVDGNINDVAVASTMVDLLHQMLSSKHV